MKKLSIFIICALCALGTNLFAQGKQLVKIPQAAESAAKAARQSAAVAVKVPAVPKVPSVPTPPVVPAHPRVAAFVNQHPHTLVGLQKMVGLSTRQAWTNLKQLGAVYTPKNPRPKLLEEQAFVTEDFTQLIPAPKGKDEAPTLIPFQNQRGLIYRGLALNADGKAIRNILENGLRVQDSGEESNTLRIAYASRGGPSAVKTVLDPVINLTSGPNSASSWAAKRMRHQDIRVVVVVHSQEQGSIIVETKDIPPADIYAVTALLNIDGTRTWCKVELEGENFRITPYVPFSASSRP